MQKRRVLIDLSRCAQPHSREAVAARALLEQLAQEPSVEVTGLLFSREWARQVTLGGAGTSAAQRLQQQALFFHGPPGRAEKPGWRRGMKGVHGAQHALEPLADAGLFEVIWRDYLSCGLPPSSRDPLSRVNYAISSLNAAVCAERKQKNLPAPLLQTEGCAAALFPGRDYVRAAPGTRLAMGIEEIASWLEEAGLERIARQLPQLWKPQEEVPRSVKDSDFYADARPHAAASILRQRFAERWLAELQKQGKGMPLLQGGPVDGFKIPRYFLVMIPEACSAGALAQLAPAIGKLRNLEDARLLLATDADWTQWPDAVKQLRKPVLEGAVGVVAHLSPEERRVLYSCAEGVFAFADGEGAGVRGLEAMLCNAPVVAPNQPDCRRLYKRSVLYCDPSRADSLYSSMRLLLEKTPNGIARRAAFTQDGAHWAAYVTGGEALPKVEAPTSRADLRYIRHGENLPVYFLHVAKAAGTSVRVLLENGHPSREVCPAYYLPELARLERSQAAGCRLFRGHFGLELLNHLQMPMRTFTWLREPRDLLLSTYYFTMQNKIIPDTMTLPEWLEIAGQNLMALNLIYGRTRTPGLAEVPEGQLWEDANAVLEGCFMIGLAEQFEDSLNLLCHKLDLFPPHLAQRLNATQRRRKVDELPEALLKTIEGHCSVDHRLYRVGAGRFRKQMDAFREELVASGALSAEQAQDTREVRRVLRQRFFERRRGVRPRRRLTFTFDRELIGEGWHLRESNPRKGTWRWVGPSREAVLYLPLAAEGEMAIQIGVSNFIKAGLLGTKILRSLRLAVNGVSVPLRRALKGRGVRAARLVLQGSIPREILQRTAQPPFAELRFSVCQTRSRQERDPESLDSRRLSVALGWISLEAKGMPPRRSRDQVNKDRFSAPLA